MIQLSGLLWAMAIIFGVMGFMRGLSRELIAMSGIILGLFALFEFDDVIRGALLATLPAEQKFFIQTILFIVIVFFAYQTRGLRREVVRQEARADTRDNLQASVLGGIVGFINGYLIWGSIWYFMDINGYPLNPYITPPLPGSSSAQVINMLPLYVLTGPNGNANLLALAVIVLFVFVLIII